MSMMAESRTAKSIRNVKVALLFYFLNLVLQFFSRKVFLDYLGAEVLGLNTTAQNLLGFLNLAELGIGTAVAYNLYKPLFDKDYEAINAIVSIQGWLYRRVAYIVIAGACLLMCFFPLIFAKAEVPLWYAYGSFIVLLISALLGYFVNYRQIVLSADQKQYKITSNIQSVKILKVVSQIIAIRFFEHGYVWWMVLEVVMAIVSSYILDWVVRKEYPCLCPQVAKGKELQLLYPEIINKTKQVFFHKIGGLVLTQTTPLVIYGYVSLTLVAIYGNYLLIIEGVKALVNALLNSIGAGVGNLVAEGDQRKIKSVFWELTVSRMWIASVICFGIYTLSDSFITLWVGKEYVLPKLPLLILTANTFILLTRTNDVFIAAYGLFQDIGAPVVEASLNLGLSILLGYFFGLSGILLGVFISLLLVVYSWKPYFLYTRGFKEPILEYVMRLGRCLFLLLFSFLIVSIVVQKYIQIPNHTYFLWMLRAFVVVLVFGLFSAGLLYLIDESARSFFRRICNIIRFNGSGAKKT